MAFPLFNSIATWFLKKRIHQIELFVKYPNEVQQEVLQDLVGMAKKTKMGYKHDFSSINNYKVFRNAFLSFSMKLLQMKLMPADWERIIFFGQHPLNGMPNQVEQQMPKANLFL